MENYSSYQEFYENVIKYYTCNIYDKVPKISREKEYTKDSTPIRVFLSVKDIVTKELNYNTPIDNAANLIFRLLKEKLFTYENTEMAAFCGYQFLKKIDENIKKFSIGAITDKSTCDNIKEQIKNWF